MIAGALLLASTPVGSSLASIAAVIVAAVLVVAAVSKGSKRGETEREFTALGLRWPSLLARAVPAVELAIAVALVVSPRVGGPASLALLVMFTAVLVRTLRSGQEVTCGCFGPRNRAPLTWWAVVRNGALILLAGLASATTSLSAPDPAVLLALLGAAVVVAVTVQLWVLSRVLGRIWSVELAGEHGRIDDVVPVPVGRNRS